MPQVGIVMGSRSDEPMMQECAEVLERFGIEYEIRVISAHRTPERAQRVSDIINQISKERDSGPESKKQ